MIFIEGPINAYKLKSACNAFASGDFEEWPFSEGLIA